MAKPHRSKHKRPALDKLRDLARRIFRQRNPETNPEPLDPYADKLAPLRRGPKPHSGAAAVAEPEEE